MNTKLKCCRSCILSPVNRWLVANSRAEFWREARALSVLQDDNLVRVLGVCTQEDPPLLLLEYGQHGDLKTFLQTNEITTNFSLAMDENAKLIKQVSRSSISSVHPTWRKYDVFGRLFSSYGTLIYMASQIASGMNHLEKMNYIHRDLATRNCLVGNGYSIKVSDFAMANDKYRQDYCALDSSGNVLVPIRWMAWESVILVSIASLYFRIQICQLRSSIALGVLLSPTLHWGLKLKSNLACGIV